MPLPPTTATPPSDSTTLALLAQNAALVEMLREQNAELFKALARKDTAEHGPTGGGPGGGDGGGDPGDDPGYMRRKMLQT